VSGSSVSRTYSIRELTKELGVTARTLRHYESEGLISPERRGQTRLYSARDRARISLVLRGRRVGFSLTEIREILELYDVGDGGISQLLRARAKFAERIALLTRQKTDIEVSLAELKLGLVMIENKLAEREPPQRPSVRVTGYGVMPAEDRE
jgi:DNA-binding transcriptional MerR regulator